MTIKITPKIDCKACRGGGTVGMGSVPYGSTWVSLPDDYCDCVIDQLPEDGDNSEIELVFSQEVLDAWAADVKAENDFLAQLQEDTREAFHDEHLYRQYK